MPRLTVEELTELTARALRRAGASKSAALAAARALVAAEAEGLSGHGVSRTALYAQHVREGRVDGRAKPKIDPRHYTEKLDIAGVEPALLLSQLRMMLLIRRIEEVIGDGITEGKVHCPCHLGIGQEAVAVGVSAHLRASDRVFGTHRSHPHYLALGGDVYELLAEVLGRVDGCSGGMGGSMHLQAQERGFYGSVPIVGATVPIAVGAAIDLGSLGAADTFSLRSNNRVERRSSARVAR